MSVSTPSPGGAAAGTTLVWEASHGLNFSATDSCRFSSPTDHDSWSLSAPLTLVSTNVSSGNNSNNVTGDVISSYQCVVPAASASAWGAAAGVVTVGVFLEDGSPRYENLTSFRYNGEGFDSCV